MIPDNWNFLANLLGTPEPAEPPAKPEDDAKQEQSAAAESTSSAAQPPGQTDAVDETGAADVQPTGETDSSAPGDSATVAEEVLTALTSVTPPPSLPGFGVRDADPKLDELAASPASADLPRETPAKLEADTGEDADQAADADDDADPIAVVDDVAWMELAGELGVDPAEAPPEPRDSSLPPEPSRSTSAASQRSSGTRPKKKKRGGFGTGLGLDLGPEPEPEPEIDLTPEAAAEQSSSATTRDSGRDEGRSGRSSRGDRDRGGSRGRERGERAERPERERPERERPERERPERERPERAERGSADEAGQEERPGAEDDGANGSGLPMANLNKNRSNQASAPQQPPRRRLKLLGLVAAVGLTAMRRVVVGDHVMKVAGRSIRMTTMMIALRPNCWTRLRLLMAMMAMTKSVHAGADVADAVAGVPSGRQAMRRDQIWMLTSSMIVPKRKSRRLMMIMKTMRRPKRFVVVADVHDVVASGKVNPTPCRGTKVMTIPIVAAVETAIFRHGSIPSRFSSMRTS